MPGNCLFAQAAKQPGNKTGIFLNNCPAASLRNPAAQSFNPAMQENNPALQD